MVQAAHSLKTVVEFKNKPAWWHVKFRTIDDLCLSIRTLRKYYEKNKEIEQWDDDFQDQLVETELSVIIEVSEILEQELKSGLRSDRGRSFVRGAIDLFGMTPISRGDHFIFGILDLIQQHARKIESAKVNDKIVKVALKVAQESRYSFLRCKAFELLATMTTKRDISPDQEVKEMLNTWPTEIQEKAKNQWKMIKRRVEDVEEKLAHLRGEAPTFQPPKLKMPVKTQTPIIEVLPLKNLS